MQYTAIIFSILLLIIVIFALINFSQKIRKLQKTSSVDGMRSEVNELILALNQTTDRNISLLEERIERLTSLLRDTDKRLKLLRTESEKSRAEPVVYNQLGRIRESQNVTETPVRPVVVAKTRKERIMELHNNGFTSTVIASRIGATIGEVELVISLIEGK